MKSGSFFIMLLLGAACFVMSIVLILIAYANQGMQARLQNQQRYLNDGLLGQQGRQISGNVLQDMDSAAAKNAGIRAVMEQHNYRKPEGRPAATSTKTPGDTGNAPESEKAKDDKAAEAPKP